MLVQLYGSVYLDSPDSNAYQFDSYIKSELVEVTSSSSRELACKSLGQAIKGSRTRIENKCAAFLYCKASTCKKHPVQ